jgi:hypothetical protein
MKKSLRYEEAHPSKSLRNQSTGPQARWIANGTTNIIFEKIARYLLHIGGILFRAYLVGQQAGAGQSA